MCFSACLTLKIISMILPKLVDSCHSLANQFGRKFTRREDLTSQDRLSIANAVLSAQLFGEWGTITALANQYNVSRTFVYTLASTLKEAALMIFGEAAGSLDSISTRDLSIQTILSLRLEGRSGIGPISTILSRFGLKL